MKRAWLWYFLLAEFLWSLLIAGVALHRCYPPQELPPMPAYSLVAEAGAEQVQGSDPAGVSLGPVEPEATLALVVRPSRTVIGPVEVRAFLARGGRSWPWAVAFEPLSAGVFVLRAPLRELPDLGPGSWDLWFLVGRPEELPRQLPAEPAAESGGRWQLLRARLEIATVAKNEQAPVK